MVAPRKTSADKEVSTQDQAKTGETTPGGEHNNAIKSALKKETRRVSVVEDYSAELDEISSLQKKL